jgi:hypothetical protein
MDRFGLPDVPAAIPFPDPRAVIAEDAKRFRRLSDSERWQELFALHAWGTKQAAASGRRNETDRLWADEENRWRRIQAELFSRHVR